MAFVNHVPGMEEGDETRNVLVGVLYVLAFSSAVLALAAMGGVLPGEDGPGDGPPTAPPDGTPTDSPPPTVDGDGNGSNRTVDVETLFSETRASQGLTTAVSENGSMIAYGLGTDVALYDDRGESERLPLEIDRSLTHLRISDRHDRIVAGSRDANSFGAIDTSGERIWSFTLSGLWNLDATENMSAASAVTYPEEGPGRMRTVADGTVQRSVDFEDAVGESTAISDDRRYVVVGAGYYWTESEREGTPGVRMYDANGTLNWSHDTEENVLSVGMNVDENIVVAGTDDGRLLAFDLEGNLLWEDEDDGGYVELSEDGSTVVSAQSSNVVAFDAEGNRLWRTDLGNAVSEDVFVSSDGERVLATGWMSGGATFIEGGDVVWTETYEGGPVLGALSDDGRTWSIIVQNTDAGSSDVHAYRLEADDATENQTADPEDGDAVTENQTADTEDVDTATENQSSDSAAAGSASVAGASSSR